MMGMWLTTLLLAVALLGTGCVFSMPGPTTPLTSDQAKDVLACQETIKKEGVEFLEHKIEKLEKCLDKVLEAQVKFENGLITQSQFDTLLAKAQDDCKKKYAEISQDSTKLVDQIAGKCTYYAETYLTGGGCSNYDPLQFSYLNLGAGCLTSPIGPAPVSPAEGLGGFICGIKEATADLDIALQVPRMGSLLGILGTDFYVDEGPVRLPNIPIDPRCVIMSVGGLPSTLNLNLLQRP